MKFIFLGMGSVGSLWASKLLLAGYNVIGFCRGKHYENIRENGLIFRDINEQTHVFRVNEQLHVYSPSIDTSEYTDLINNLSEDDWIIITGKAYSLPEIIEDYKDLIRQKGSVLILQNGIGNEDIIHEKLPQIIMYRGTTTNGSFMVGSGEIQFTGHGFTKFGIPNVNEKISDFNDDTCRKQLQELVENLQKTSFSMKISDTIDLILWEKIFVNIGINAPATIEGIPNGELLESKKRMDLMKDAITEAWKVGRALGIPLKERPNDYIELAYDVARKTSKNKNSMLQDIMNHKPTEIDFINGRIVSYAEQLGIEVPTNEYLTEEIKKLENTR